MVPYVSSQEHEERPVQVLLFRASPRSLGFVTTWVGRLGLRRGAAGSCSTLRPPPRPRRRLQRRPQPAPAGRRLLLNERPLPPRGRAAGAPSSGASPKPRTTGFLAELAPPRAGPRSHHPGPGSGVGGLPEAGPAARRELPARLPDRSAPFPAPVPACRTGPNCRPASSSACAGNGRGPWGSKDFVLAVPVGGH